jgi:spore coat protein U-like protein
MNRTLFFFVGSALALLAPLEGAEAATCTAQPTAVAFGSYDTLDPSALDGVGEVTVQCDADTAFTIDLGSGTGTVDQRIMSGATGTLNYNLYTDAARTALWGDGISGSDVSASGTNVTTTVYGRIPGLQNVGAGSYSDTVTVTITY